MLLNAHPLILVGCIFFGSSHNISKSEQRIPSKPRSLEAATGRRMEPFPMESSSVGPSHKFPAPAAAKGSLIQVSTGPAQNQKRFKTRSDGLPVCCHSRTLSIPRLVDKYRGVDALARPSAPDFWTPQLSFTKQTVLSTYRLHLPIQSTHGPQDWFLWVIPMSMYRCLGLHGSRYIYYDCNGSWTPGVHAMASIFLGLVSCRVHRHLRFLYESVQDTAQLAE